MYLLVCSTASNIIKSTPTVRLLFQIQLFYLNKEYWRYIGIVEVHSENWPTFLFTSISPRFSYSPQTCLVLLAVCFYTFLKGVNATSHRIFLFQ